MRITPLSQCENSFQPDYLRDRDRPKDKVNYNIEKVKMAYLSVRRRLTNEESWFCWSMVGRKSTKNPKSQLHQSLLSLVITTRDLSAFGVACGLIKKYNGFLGMHSPGEAVNPNRARI